MIKKRISVVSATEKEDETINYKIPLQLNKSYPIINLLYNLNNLELIFKFYDCSDFCESVYECPFFPYQCKKCKSIRIKIGDKL